MIHTAAIDLDRPGKQQGFLQVPYSHNLGAWANAMVPITVIARGTGPTVLCLGGNHGDEYQGQVAIMRLARETDPAEVSGRLILVPDKEQRRRMLAAMLAWNTDFSFLHADIAGSGLLPVEAENQGKTVVTTELGGGEGIPAHVHRIAQRGLRNVLVHTGVLAGKEETRESLGLPPAILVQALAREDYILAPESGVFEVAVELGAKVGRGATVGWIHDLERPDREPERIVTASAGFVVCTRAPCLTSQGDCVAVIAREVSREEVLEA
jgi:predicted deacylase